MTVRTLNELFFAAAAEHDKTDAFRVRTGGAYHAVSHRAALQVVEEVSQGLQSLGVSPGDRVAVFSENRVEWALADFAILASGAVNVPVYPTLPARQAGSVLADSAARVIFCAPGEPLRKVEEIRTRLSPDAIVVTWDGPGWVPEDSAGLPRSAEETSRRLAEAAATREDPVPGGSTLTWSALRRRGALRAARDPAAHRTRAEAVKEDDPASLIYTSGTSGEPKGVVLTHGNIVSNVVSALQVFPIGPLDSCLSFLPLSHIFERMAGHFTMFLAGATIAYAESMETVPKNLLEVRPSVLISVPRLYEKMYARVTGTVARSLPPVRALFRWAMSVGRERSRFVLANSPVPEGVAVRYRIATAVAFRKIRERLGGRIRFMVSGGAPLSPELVLFFHAAGLTILEGYGLTETSPVIACNRLDAMKPGTVGQPIPGVEVKIADDGEILVKSPGVMKEYFGRPADTAAALAGGWFHTGDVGHLDPDGFLSITDRKKDLIVTAGGKKVAPQPIENRLRQDPYIAEVVLLGDGHPYVVALVIPEMKELEAWARARGVTGDDGSLCRNPAVVEFLGGRVLAVNAGLASFEQIKKVALIETPPTIEEGALTPTLKVRRRVFTERHRDVIDALYAKGLSDTATAAPDPPDLTRSRSASGR